jgi:outer membrane protein TolC
MDFKAPAPPDVDRYTREPLRAQTAATDSAQGAAQHFDSKRDIPGDWWKVFHSRGINALIEESLTANPNLQAALASLRATKESVYAQQGRFFPTVQASSLRNRSRRSWLQGTIPSISTPRRCWSPTRSTSGAAIAAWSSSSRRSPTSSASRSRPPT